MTAILSVPIGGIAFAQSEFQSYQLYCPEGPLCSCTEASGVWVDETTGFRINA